MFLSEESMDWQQLEILERNKAWPDAVGFVKDAIAANPQDAEGYVRAIYLLLNLVLEEDYAGCGLNHDDLADMLKNYFDSSYERFSDNGEYLFFVGYFMGLAEWYFGQEDLDLSRQMLKRAVQIEPQNRLYEWALRFVTADEAANDLSRQLLSDERTMKWLESKGGPGAYMAWAIKMNCEKYVIDHGSVKRIGPA